MSLFLFSWSTIIPQGERTFIRLANLVKSDITNENIKKNIDLFIKQEVNHQKIHKIYNDKIFQKDFDTRFIVKREEFLRSLTKKYYVKNKNNYGSFSYRLYMSERFSEAFALWFLDIDSEFHSEEKKLWTWHSLEEIEHNFLGGDLLENYNSPSKLKQIIMKLKITSWFLEIFFRTFAFSSKDGLFKKVSFYKDIIRFFFTFKYFPKLIIYVIKTIIFEREILTKKNYINSLPINQSY